MQLNPVYTVILKLAQTGGEGEACGPSNNIASLYANKIKFWTVIEPYLKPIWQTLLEVLNKKSGVKMTT